MTPTRRDTLRKLLVDRRSELTEEISGHTPNSTPRPDIQDDIECALINMKQETITKLNDALLRLERGTYGICNDCHEEITEKRLRALPFAARCKDCEERREYERAKENTRFRMSTSLLFEDDY